MNLPIQFYWQSRFANGRPTSTNGGPTAGIGSAVLRSLLFFFFLLRPMLPKVCFDLFIDFTSSWSSIGARMNLRRSILERFFMMRACFSRRATFLDLENEYVKSE